MVPTNAAAKKGQGSKFSLSVDVKSHLKWLFQTEQEALQLQETKITKNISNLLFLLGRNTR